MDSTTYETKVQQQIDQYRHVENMHDLPDVFHYWSNKYLRPKLNAILGIDTIPGFYAEYFRRATLGHAGPYRFASLGAGDCSLEIEVAKALVAGGLRDFTLDCLELSPVLLERAQTAAQAQGVAQHLEFKPTDLNQWAPEAKSYTGVMASHSLHHMVELERIFSATHSALRPTGVFVTSDMIGRNGHMRWPEALKWVEQIWNFLPDRLKLNRQLNTFDARFVNRDCSTESFEGVRAQDILPLLVEKFGFTHFVAYGGLIDVFVDRGYGHNFDPASEKDKALIDFIESLNATLLAQGLIKPTMMFAVMTPQPSAQCRQDGVLGPQFCVRHTGLKIHKLHSLEEFQAHWQRMQPEFAERQALAESLCAPHRANREPFTVPAFSYPAGQTVDLQVDWLYSSGPTPNWRERLLCPITGLNMRLRANVQLIDSYLKLGPDSSVYLTEQVTPLYEYLRRKHSNLTGSEFVSAKLASGTIDARGIRHEDLTHLSFPAATFDAVLSFECLEHMPDFLAAFRECHRVLKSGGVFFFSVPFTAGKHPHTVRAQLKPDGTIEHLLEPEYHGDPMQSEGCLCFTHFGWQLIDDLRAAGFSDPHAVSVWSKEFGYLGDELLCFSAVKP